VEIEWHHYTESAVFRDFLAANHGLDLRYGSSEGSRSSRSKGRMSDTLRINRKSVAVSWVSLLHRSHSTLSAAFQSSLSISSRRTHRNDSVNKLWQDGLRLIREALRKAAVNEGNPQSDLEQFFVLLKQMWSMAITHP
jgi:hypothetical protein